ncbi:MAG TPA: lactonase family protein [Bryobacteraceae bacterium]|nr:lactonase family protein [Bryobacteraceae bacterium]
MNRIPNQLSRRALLKHAGLLAASPCLLAQSGTAPGGRRLAYVASYSSPQGPEGSKGYGRGIYLFEMDPASGKLSRRDVFPNDSNPSWLAFDSSQTHLYSANETAIYKGEQSGSVSAWSIDRSTGRLSLLNTESSHGASPCYVSVHPSGRYALVANYHGGTVAVLPVLPGGKLRPATDVKSVAGQPGPTHATSAPEGSFAISGHDRSHAHMIHTDPSGRFVLSADLGLDRILLWKLDLQSGKLTPNDPPSVSLPPGDGPRHFTFHPNGRWLYCLTEEGSTLVSFEYDPARGQLKAMQTVSTLPKGFAGSNFTSEVMISRDARFLYAANRLHDSIAWFAIGPRGTLTLAGEEWTRGDYPRSFNIDPSGGFLYSCNQRADAVACFRVNRETGALTFTGQYTPVGTPAMILFLT